ncbi:MAG: SpvB/TcaC N-terminal domain-containing protein, partial [Rubricella sp.]
MSERAALAPREFALERSTLDCAVSVSALDGGAQASFPVQVTEGREGFHPTLAFAYAGSRANSPYGVGWSLSGAEAVTRDTSWRLPQYRDGEDRFHLAGSEIVPLIDGGARVTRAEGGFTVERWRARTERLFERIEKWTENATGRVHWRRFARDGTLSIYGLAADGSTRIADPADPSRVSEWLVERRHSPRGDVMAFRYKAEDTAGVDPAEPVERHRLDPAAQPMRYLKAIRYGATVPWDGFGPQPAGLDYLFEVILDYGEHGAAGGLPDPTEGVSWPVRPDAYSSYRRGFEVRTRRLCRRVLMVHRLAELPGPTVVSATELDHTDRPEGAVLTAARRIGYRPAAGGGVPVSRATPDVSFGYGEASLGGGFASAPQVAEGGLMGAIERRAHLFVDLKGEGLPGLLTRDRDAWLWRENLGGGRFAPARPLPSAPKVAALAMSVGDGDGDGRTSVDTVIGREAGGWRYDGGGPEPGWQPHRTLAAQARADTGTARVQFADLNGDGYPDLLIDRGESFDWFPAKGSDGFAPARSLPKPVDEFGAPVGTGSAATGHFWGDMTGDGLADLVRISAGRVEVWPNLGQGRFGRSFVMDDAPRLPDALPPGRLILADADLDGRADILIVGEGEITLWRNLSGNRFAPPEVLRGLPVIDTASQLQVLDLMGDGRPCLVWASQVPGRADAPLQYLPLTTAIRPGLLERVETGTGLTHRIDWGWSGEDYTSARAAGEPWATLLPRHRPIVRALRAEDAVTGATRATLYRFADGGFDHDERRFTGFGRCETLDQDTGIGGDPAAPPRLTRVWSHLGAAQPAALAGRWSGDPAASPPPWAAVEDEAALATRDYDEASRAVAGLLLRREVYGCAPDGTPDADPISVHVSGYRIAPLQPSLSTVTRAAFAPVQAETLTWLYEDSRDDPRVTHTVRLARSATGGEERVAEFSYARRPGPGRLPEQSVAHGSVRVRRQRGIDRDRAYQPDVLLETQRHHISGLGARHEPFTHAEADATVQAALAAPAPFGSAPPPGLHATLIAAQRMRYWTEARDGIAAEAALPDHPLLHSTRSAVMPTARFQAAFGTLGALPALLAETGLVDDAGMVWTPSAVSHYRDRADFNRLERTVTPDGAETRLAWRADGLAPLSITGEDGAISSGVLDPFTAEIARTTDPNGTIVETAYDPLGQPVRHTMRGQQRDAGGALHPVGGDPLPGGPDPDGGLDLTGALVDPEAALGTQSGAVFYDLSSRPVRRLDLTREEHADDGAGGRIANARVAVALTYIDGFGTTLQTRVRGGAGPAISRDGGGAILVTPEGTLLMADAPLRWLVSGFEHRSANGLPLELFEPFFSPVPDYEDDEALRRNGVSRRNTYDAMGRVLRVDHPDGSVERSEWYAWHQIDHDRNDAVTGTAYEATRSGLSPSHPERIALEQARRHAGTPTRTDIGSAGEIAIITETAEGGASRQTRTTLSVPEGRDVMTDPRGLSTVRQADMAGRAWRTQSPDAGAVLTLRRWDGSVSRSLDARGVLVLTRYDTLSRPIETEVIEGAAPARITERIAYGPADAATAERNLVGRVASIEDEAGLWTALRAAPSGDLLEETRRFRANHRAVVDLAAPPPLDPETHRTIRLFDALGRVTEFTAADGSVTRTTHGPFGEAERVGVTTADGVLSDREIASGFTHDARGRLVSGLIGGVVALARTYQRTTPRPETITAT